MPCRPLPGGMGIACSRGSRKRCKVPGCTRDATKLCDWPVTARASGTCDMDLCARHAKSIAPDRDYCPAHAKLDSEAVRP